MSAVVKTVTPFIDQESLEKALDTIGIKYTVEHNKIVTNRKDYFGQQYFVKENGAYSFRHDRDQGTMIGWGDMSGKNWKPVTKFLEEIEVEYRKMFQKKLEQLERDRLEEEARKLEEQRKQYIEKQKTEIYAKAEAKGYRVKEKKVGAKIKLVLVKHTY